MLRKDKLKLMEIKHKRLLTYLVTKKDDVSGFNKMAEEEAELVNEYIDTLANRKPTQDRKVSTAKMLRAAYMAAFKDTDPKSIDAVAEGLRQQRLARKIIRPSK